LLSRFFFDKVATHDFILVYQKSCLFSILGYFPCVSLYKNDGIVIIWRVCCDVPCSPIWGWWMLRRVLAGGVIVKLPHLRPILFYLLLLIHLVFYISIYSLIQL